MKQSVLIERIHHFLDGALESQERQDLKEALATDEEVRKLYLEIVDIHSLLSQRVDHTHTAIPGQIIPMDRVIARQKRRNLRSSMIVAAILVGIAVAVSIFIMLPESPLARFAVSPDSKFTITHAIAEGDKEPEGDVLAVGSRVTLLAGALELQIASGVEGIFRAPADFTLRSESVIDLHHGTAWFEVSDEAVGFQVDTPEFLLTDLGTEFGVKSQENISDQVHVFSGAVRVQSHLGFKETVELEASEACETVQDGGWETIAFHREEFMTVLPDRSLSPRYLHWSFDGESPFQVKGTLSDADKIKSQPVQSDGRAESSRLVPGKLGHALLFDGRGDHMKTDWEGFLGRTPRTLACWIKLHPDEPEGWGVIADWGDSGQAGGGWRARVRAFADPSDGAFFRASTGGNWCSTRTNIADGEWHHVAISDDLRAGDDGFPSVRLYVDGEEEVLTWSPRGLKQYVGYTERGDPLIVGRPFPEVNQVFRGLIDELFIIEGALSQEEIRRLMATGSP